MENVREIHTNNYMSFYHHHGATCPYCNHYDNRLASIQAINQHIRLVHQDFLRYGRAPNQYLSWNNKVFVVYEPCPICGQLLAGTYSNHFKSRRSCAGIGNEPLPWLVGAMFEMLDQEQSGVFMAWREFVGYCIKGDLRQRIESLLEEALATFDGFNVYINGQENLNSQKLYIVVDFELRQVYIGETVADLMTRMNRHRGEYLKMRKGGCGRLMMSGRYLMTVVGGFLQKKKGTESSYDVDKFEIKLLEEKLRQLFVLDGSWEVLNDGSCKFFFV